MGIKYRGQAKWRAYTDAGAPGVGYKLYTYTPGTTTLKNTYSDSAGASPNTNPIIFDSRGESTIFWNGTYDLKLTTDTDVLVWTASDYGTGEDVVNYGNYNLVTDGGFEDDSNGDGLPDQWTVTTYPTAGAGAGTAVLDSTTQIEGLYALKFTSQGDGGGYAVSDYFNVREGSIIGLSWQMQSSVATVRNVVEVIWYTSAKVQISTSTIYDASTGNPTSWTEETGSATVPSTARFAKIRTTGCHSSVSTPGSTWFDDVFLVNLKTYPSNQVLANNVALQGEDTGGTARDLIKTNANDQSEIGNTTYPALLKFLNYAGFGAATDTFIDEISGDIYLSSGAYYNGTNWIATQTAASIEKLSKAGGKSFYYDSGLTVSASFTPTVVFTVSNAGVISTGYINNSNWSGIDLSVANGGSGASDAMNALANFGFLGDGSDGALSYTSGTNNLASGVYNVASLNVSAGATLQSAETSGGYLVFLCTGTATIAGTISLSGRGPAGGTVNPAAGNGNTGTSGSYGGSGGGGGAASITYDGAAGGAGKHVSGGAGGLHNAGNGSAGSTSAPTSRDLNNELNRPQAWGGYYQGGGGGGSGGTYGVSDLGGAGGNGGGTVIIIAPTIDFTGTINVSGANGSAGTGAYGGGGGGGAGGLIATIANTYTADTGTRTISGGSGGVGPVSNGGAGGTGYSFDYTY